MILPNSSRLAPLLREYRRPWKLLSLGFGVGLLIAGAYWYRAPDWDVGVSLIMALFAYLTAAWSLRVVVTRRWRAFPLAVFWTWWTVDGCYAIYWSIKDPAALVWMRSANAPASFCLYLACGLVWYFQGSWLELWRCWSKFGTPPQN